MVFMVLCYNQIMNGNHINRHIGMDLLRELFVFYPLFFHTARIFDEIPGYYIKSESGSPLLTMIVIFTSLVGMPILFFIAGYCLLNSLKKRNIKELFIERFKRLMVPFFFGLLLLAPPLAYIEEKTKGLNGSYDKSYFQFLADFFSVTLTLDFPWFVVADPKVGIFQATHFWFLYILFLFTFIMLPFLLYLVSKKGEVFLIFLKRAFVKTPVFFLLAAPIGLIEAYFGTSISGGWNHNVYLAVIFYGFVFASLNDYESLEPFNEVFRKNLKASFLSGIILLPIVFAWYLSLKSRLGAEPLTSMDIESMGLRFFKGVLSWLWVVVFIGLAIKFVNSDFFKKRKKVIEKLEKDAFFFQLPFYALNQTVVVIIGYYVLLLDIHLLLKFMAVFFFSLFTMVLIYKVLIKRIPFMRFLFGMRAR